MTEQIKTMRNFALAGHSGAGKTSLAEAMLFKAGGISRHGRVEDGNTAMDFLPEEISKQQSISTSFFKYTYNKHDITLMDTPGDQNFFSAAKTCIPAADSVCLVIDGVDGPSAMTEEAADCAAEYNLPAVVFVNKLDRERSDFKSTVENAAAMFKKKIIITHLPVGSENDFKGVVDILTGTAYIYDEEGNVSKQEIPDDMKDEMEEAKAEFIENVAEMDDDLLERYLEGHEPTLDELKAAFRKGILDAEFYTAICGAATRSIGVDCLFDFINDYMPSPLDRGSWSATDHNGEEVSVECDPDAEFSALVFNTIADAYAGRLSVFRVISGKTGKEGNIYNVTKGKKERFTQLLELAGKTQKPASQALPGSIVAVAKLKETLTGDTLTESSDFSFKPFEPLPPVISFAVEPKAKGDEDKIHESLRKILEEDQGLMLKREEETKETLLWGRGLVHIETTCEKLKRKYSVEVNIKTPKVPYRETIKKSVRVQGKHKKQSGGHGQFGDCWITMEPLPRGEGFEFANQIVGGAIPKNYIPAVEAGIKESAERGFLAGFPCVDFKVILDDGSYHSVDSSEMAFKMAGSLAFKSAVQKADPVMLEPVMKVSVMVPDAYTGDVMGDFNSRRGKVLGMDALGEKQVINAHVPMSEMLRYAPDLRSMTGGRGTFTMEFDHYEEMPGDLAGKVIEKVNAENEESS